MRGGLCNGEGAAELRRLEVGPSGKARNVAKLRGSRGEGEGKGGGKRGLARWERGGGRVGGGEGGWGGRWGGVGART